MNAKGAKYWLFRFSWVEKQPRISLGTYPEISLRDARALRDVARALVARGVQLHFHGVMKESDDLDHVVVCRAIEHDMARAFDCSMGGV